jgi:hypothetical protein
MKLLLTILALVLSFSAFSQNDASGVYKTAADFRNNKLSLPSTCAKTNNMKVRFKSRFVLVTEGRQRHKLAKGEVFAVQTCKNTFRIQGKDEYRVINKDRIPLYSQTIPTGSEGAFYEDIFFFSVEPDSEIIPLTKEALKKAYPENQKFHTLIDSSFKGNADLGSFNQQLKEYMVVYFYNQSLK